MKVPVIVFAYNRPEKLRRVLNALRGEGAPHLLIFVDGPRSEDDLPHVAACQELARSVEWSATEIFLAERNQGVASILRKIHAVMARHPAAIFLEDDCLPVRGFYGFMCAALERYRDDPQVFSIGGYQHLEPDVFRGYPYSLVSGTRFVGWGWATWQAKWQRAQPLIEDYRSLFEGLSKVPQVAGDDIGPAARRMAAGQGIDNWDLRVALAALALKQVHLVAVRGLVRTLGQDVSGMHGSASNILRARFLHNRNVAGQAPEHPVWLEDSSANWAYVSGLRDFVHRSQALSIRGQIRRWAGVARRLALLHPQRLHDVNLDDVNPQLLQKRALLSYITHPFSISEEDPRFHRHVNIWHAQEMARALNRLGYRVDVIDYRDTDFQPDPNYDLFIGHGGVNFTQISTRLACSTPKIYFSTGSYWRFHNQQERQRFADLERRRGVALKPDREITHPEEDALQTADAIIGIGNHATRQTYRDWERVWMIPGTARFDDTFDWFPVDLAEGRNHFLFFASGGNIHKGLDLALEAFVGLEQHLWVMAPLDPAFRRVYRRELFDLPNIHPLGYVTPRSTQYYQALRQCAWCLLPSCSEGQAQSVVEAMNAGLIPLVTRAAGVDVAGFGMWIEPATVDAIRRCVTEAAHRPMDELWQRSRRSQAAARSTYAPESFGRNFREALQQALALPQAAGGAS